MNSALELGGNAVSAVMNNPVTSGFRKAGGPEFIMKMKAGLTANPAMMVTSDLIYPQPGADGTLDAAIGRGDVSTQRIH